jgi:hypothetical protein
MMASAGNMMMAMYDCQLFLAAEQPPAQQCQGCLLVNGNSTPPVRHTPQGKLHTACRWVSDLAT